MPGEPVAGGAAGASRAIRSTCHSIDRDTFDCFYDAAGGLLKGRGRDDFPVADTARDEVSQVLRDHQRI